MAEELDKETESQLGKMALKIASGKNRGKLLALIAEEDPTIPIPEVTMQKEIEAATKPLQEQIAKMQEDSARNAQLADIENKRAPLRKRGLDNEAIKKVETFMLEKKIFDHEVGYENWERSQRVAAPTSASRSSVEMPTTKELFENPQKWARTEAHKVADELAAARA